MAAGSRLSIAAKLCVYRLIAKGTLEGKIQELQRTKATLANALQAGMETQGLQIKPQILPGILSPE